MTAPFCSKPVRRICRRSLSAATTESPRDPPLLTAAAEVAVVAEAAVFNRAEVGLVLEPGQRVYFLCLSLSLSRCLPVLTLEGF